MRRNTRVLVCSLALLACQRGDLGGDGGDPPSDGDEGDGDEGDGDGDGDPDEGDAEPVCDLSQFPKLVPEWIVEVESPLEGATPSVSALEVTSDAIFVAGRHDISSSEPPGFVERRSLTGELEWVLELPRAPFALHWDGEYVYASVNVEARRWTEDGVEDTWRFDAGARSIADLAVGEHSVAIVGRFTEPDTYEPDYADAYYGALTKTAPAVLVEGGTHATVQANDYGQRVVLSPWGGWIAAGSVDYPDYVWLRGFGGSAFSASLHRGRHPYVHTMLAYEDTLLVLGRYSLPSGLWLSALAETGAELWSTDISLCGEVSGSLNNLIEIDSRLWGLGSVRTAPENYSPLLVRLTADGSIDKIYELSFDAEYVSMSALSVTDAGIYAAGYRKHAGVPGRRIIGKLNP